MLRDPCIGYSCRTCWYSSCITASPTGIVSGLDFSTFGAPFLTDGAGVMGIVKALTTPVLLVFAFSLMMSDFFDTMGSAMAVAKQGDFLTGDSNVKDQADPYCDSAAAGGFWRFFHYHLY